MQQAQHQAQQHAQQEAEAKKARVDAELLRADEFQRERIKQVESAFLNSSLFSRAEASASAKADAEIQLKAEAEAASQRKRSLAARELMQIAQSQLIDVVQQLLNNNVISPKMGEVLLKLISSYDRRFVVAFDEYTEKKDVGKLIQTIMNIGKAEMNGNAHQPMPTLQPMPVLQPIQPPMPSLQPIQQPVQDFQPNYSMMQHTQPIQHNSQQMPTMQPIYHQQHFHHQPIHHQSQQMQSMQPIQQPMPTLHPMPGMQLHSSLSQALPSMQPIYDMTPTPPTQPINHQQQQQQQQPIPPPMPSLQSIHQPVAPTQPIQWEQLTPDTETELEEEELEGKSVLTVKSWLETIKLGEYYCHFEEAGVDDMEFLKNFVGSSQAELEAELELKTFMTKIAHRRMFFLRLNELGS
jgi:hypothetical protein